MDENIRLLTLASDGEVALCSAADTQLGVGDSHLCFGPLTEMRERLLKAK